MDAKYNSNSIINWIYQDNTLMHRKISMCFLDEIKLLMMTTCDKFVKLMLVMSETFPNEKLGAW